ncbi:Cof-type HAD-IIB family hydrolase [Lacticaseibacillus porcinae]|uniref:Cof-type HAD-IIB family hydrolase n=1 Tax=Lacticaseibacillus porcinae TaxID=1123687 RepID=UPI000F7B2C02|nr:Cof-type HAD-IIB family hydrolase [Lacticaseibacillus porcinae]
MNQKLIALDLDGTTLNQAGTLSPQTIATLQAAQTAGHLVVIATGRPDSISEHFYDELGLTAPMINFNGALIHKPHQHWGGERQVALTTQTALALKSLKTQFDIELMVAEGKQLLLADHGYVNMPFLPDLPDPQSLFDADGLTQAPISVTMFIREHTLTALQQAVAQHFPSLTPKTWGAWSGEHTALEVTEGNTSKSQAVAYVAGLYGIDQADVIAFGDDLNDLDLIDYAGVGVAMKNARPEILQAANAVTAFDNENSGMADYLADYLAL